MFCRVLCVSVHSKLCHLAGGELRYGPKPDRIPLLAYTPLDVHDGIAMDG